MERSAESWQEKNKLGAFLCNCKSIYNNNAARQTGAAQQRTEKGTNSKNYYLSAGKRNTLKLFALKLKKQD